MENKYIIDSESEEETSDAELDSIKASISTDGWKLQDIDQVRLHSCNLYHSIGFLVEETNDGFIGYELEVTKKSSSHCEIVRFGSASYNGKSKSRSNLFFLG